MSNILLFQIEKKEMQDKGKKMNTFNVEIEPPKNINIAHLNPNEVQTAFSNFFLQNPQILTRIFETLEKAKQADSVKVINPAKDYTDTQWDKLSPDLRSELETQYVLNNSELVKKIALAEENYHQGKYFIPTDEQLGFDNGN